MQESPRNRFCWGHTRRRQFLRSPNATCASTSPNDTCKSLANRTVIGTSVILHRLRRASRLTRWRIQNKVTTTRVTRLTSSVGATAAVATTALNRPCTTAAITSITTGADAELDRLRLRVDLSPTRFLSDMQRSPARCAHLALSSTVVGAQVSRLATLTLTRIATALTVAD